MRIRNARTEDLKRVSYITKLSWKRPYKEGGMTSYFHEHPDLEDLVRKKKLFIVVAVVDEKIVGAVRYEMKDKDELYFSKLVTLPSFRGKGIGTVLVTHLENIAKKKNIKKISLDVMEEKLLVPYYERMGYKPVKKVRYPNHHEVYMVKNLL